MQARIFIGVAVVVLGSGSLTSTAEPYQEFVRGLRKRQYYDLTLSYLQQIEQDKATPADIRALIPYERAVTLLESSRLLRSPEARSQQLDEAQALFERFASESPDHPLRGQANTERARILLDKARVEIWQAEAPANEGNRESFRKQARQLIAQARDVFQNAHDQHQEEWEKLKGFIPEEEKVKQARRAEAEGLYMQAQVDLARCLYEEAQTYDPGSSQRNDLLNKAAVEFEAIHQRYRSQIAGLHARMWQGKCFEEQGDIRKALGIYNEILDHPGDKLRSLQDKVRWFRLICLNHESRKDYQLVIGEATNWRKESPDRIRTLVGLGIQYELARAQQSLAASDRALSDAVRTKMMNQALDNARAVARYPGSLKTPAGALVQELMLALNKDGGEAKDFDTAFTNANLQLEETKKLSGQIAAAQSSGDTKQAQELQQTLQAMAGEMGRLYERALQLATTHTDAEQVNIARFRLAYAHFLAEEYMEAGVLADYVARKYSAEFPVVAIESAYIALAAFDRLFYEADKNDRDFEMRQVQAVARFIAETWPDSDRAIDARMAVARIYRQTDEPIRAADWYAEVPATAKQYGEAQLSAGQSYWNAYLTRAALPTDERPSAEELTDWKQKAEQHLSAGIERRQQRVPDDAATPDDLTFGKLSLVQIRNREGLYTSADGKAGAVELLTEGPHAVIEAVSVPSGQMRPKTVGAVQSKAIASLAYQQLLRARIGMRDLEGARQTREQLEAIAGTGEDAGALTQVYVEFGQELENELAQLQASGDTARLNDVRSAFESFLSDLFERQQGQTFNSLLWIAETYTGLAEGSADDSAKSKSYFDKAAATYADIVRRAAEEPNFVEQPGQLIGVKLRLVNCQRAQGDFAAADRVMREVLAERSNAIDAQLEAALLYEQWADRSPGEAAEKLRLAIQGEKDAGPMWGWALIAQKLQRAIEFGQAPAQYEQQHIDARYHLARCEFELAKHALQNEKTKHLNEARFGIQRFIAITVALPESDWQRFDGLYQQILADLGEPATPLPRRTLSGDSAPPTETVAANTGGPGNAAASPPGPAGESYYEGDGNFGNLLIIILLLALGIGTVAGIYVMTVKQDKKRRARYTADTKSSSRR